MSWARIAPAILSHSRHPWRSVPNVRTQGAEVGHLALRASSHELIRGSLDKAGKIGAMSDEISAVQLEISKRELSSALAEFEHQARRIRDRLERGGGRSSVLEMELKQVEENLDLTRRDIARVRDLLGSHKHPPE